MDRHGDQLATGDWAIAGNLVGGSVPVGLTYPVIYRRGRSDKSDRDPR